MLVAALLTVCRMDKCVELTELELEGSAYAVLASLLANRANDLAAVIDRKSRTFDLASFQILAVRARLSAAPL